MVERGWSLGVYKRRQRSGRSNVMSRNERIFYGRDQALWYCKVWFSWLKTKIQCWKGRRVRFYLVGKLRRRHDTFQDAQTQIHKYVCTNTNTQIHLHKGTWRYLHDISWYLHNKNKRQEMLMITITMFYVDDEGGDIYVTGSNAWKC